MLCSDGLTDLVSFKRIQQLLSEGTPDEAACKLVNTALEMGGKDNVTCIVIDAVEGTLAAPMVQVTTQVMLPEETTCEGSR